MSEQGGVMDLARRGRPRQGIIAALVNALSDNIQMDDHTAAALIGAAPETVYTLRKSDSFRTLLAKEVKRKHGEALLAVEGNRLAATNTALTAATEILKAPEVLPTVKLEAAKVVLEDWHKTQDRLQPKSAPTHGQTNVTVELTFNELQQARESSIAHGKTLELEASDAVHSHIAPMGRDRDQQMQQALLPAIGKGGDKVRREGQ